jgi:hypothetical protein
MQVTQLEYTPKSVICQTQVPRRVKDALVTSKGYSEEHSDSRLVGFKAPLESTAPISSLDLTFLICDTGIITGPDP